MQFCLEDTKISAMNFVWYHKNNHAPLFTALPELKENVRRYVQCHSVKSIGKVFNAKPYLELIRPDEEKFLDLPGCGFLISIENPVI